MSVFVCWLVVLIAICEGQFMVDVVEKTFGGWRLVHRCEAKGANFGLDVPTFSYGGNATGCVSFVRDDETACREVSGPPSNVSDCNDFYAFVPRGKCGFSEKAYHVQLASYRAMIVYNSPGLNPVPMDGSIYADRVHIPVVMVSYGCMDRIMESFPPEQGYKVAIRAIPGYYDLVKYLIPFVGVVGLCFIVLFLSLLFRVCRERRRIARKRLSKSNLKKLPTKKYKKGEEAETCAICLDDFVEGEKLRILPCKHLYHCKCIDPWLTRNRKVCPICKRKVCSSGDSDSSDSDVERRTTSSGGRSSITHENAPLIDNELQLASSSVASSTYFDDRSSYLLNVEDLEANRAGTSRELSTTSAVVHTDNNNMNVVEEGPYASTVVPSGSAEMHRSASSVSAVFRQKLRPLVQGIVDRASRTFRRDQNMLHDSQLGDGGHDPAEDFSAENEAFDESAEGRRTV